MIDKPLPENDRLLDLLATYATDSLSSDEESELKVLLEQEDGVTESEFEFAAAAMHLAMEDENESLSDDLVEKILADSNDFFERVTATAQVAATPAPQPQAAPAPVVVQKSGIHPREILAWIAAVAAILFAMLKPADVIVESEPTNLTAEKSDEEKLEDLRGIDETLDLEWAPQDDATVEGTSGRIVWNTGEQQGFMEINNLQQNDPTKFCYQLWIFDEDQKHPIDGGVFNITKKSQLIPIDAKIDVSKVKMFAVTVEKPGGVVVSEKERIPLLAQLTP